MKYCRFNYGNETLWGALEGETVHALASAPWPEEEKTGETFPLHDVRLLAPTVPTKIVCVGRNYKAHAAELGNPLPEQPLIFLKPPSSVIGPGEAIIYPAQSQRVDYEGELGLVIGRRCRNAKRDKALDHLFGLTCLIDVSARDLQKIDKHFARGKGFDTFCPLGPRPLRPYPRNPHQRRAPPARSRHRYDFPARCYNRVHQCRDDAGTG
jgi:2-keto-4-pentenoate hydratase/2-oxohepta-3-ene-1,7-dioic acid hydratase in catechol pathway